MTIGGAGAGGSTNVPYQIQPSIREQETTAAVEVAKTAMKLVQDSIDISLIIMDYDARKYQASANRPVLAPLISTRVLTEAGGLPDQSWVSVYNTLVDSMPADIKTLFQLSLQLPPDQQNPTFAALNSLLQDAAQALVVLGNAAAPLDAESMEAARASSNILLPYVALNSLAADTAFFTAAAETFLASVGANYINFDAYSNAAAQLSVIATDMQALVNLLQDPNASSQAAALLAAISANVAGLSDQFALLQGAGEFLILSAALDAIAAVTSALSINQPGAAALALGLDIATTGFNTADSQLGFAGPAFSALADSIAAFLNNAAIPDAPPGPQDLLANMTLIALTSAVVFGGLIAGDGFGLPPGANDPATQAAQNFGFELALLLMTSSDFIGGISGGLAGMLGANPQNQDFIAGILSTAILLGLIYGGVNSADPTAAEPLVSTFANELEAGLLSASNYVNEQLLAGNLSGEAAQELGVYLQQAAAALQGNDYGTFFSALDGIYSLAGTSTDAFLADTGLIVEQGGALPDLASTSGDDGFTGITTAA